MKKKICALLVILAIMAAVPTITNLKSYKSAEKLSKNEIITGITAYNFRKHYDKETIKAIVLILNTNYNAEKYNKDEILSKKDFVKKFKKGETYYSEIEKYVKDMENETITYKNKAVYLPYFKVSKGYTDKSKKYPCLKACACPWDTLKKDFKNSENTVGISINSLDKLCKKGLGYREAVMRFLNN